MQTNKIIGYRAFFAKNEELTKIHLKVDGFPDLIKFEELTASQFTAIHSLIANEKNAKCDGTRIYVDNITEELA